MINYFGYIPNSRGGKYMTNEKIQILELIKHYVTRGKKCDREYIRTLIELITKHGKLEDYVDISNSKVKLFSFKDCDAEYVLNDKTIYVYYLSLKCLLMRHHKRYRSVFDPISCEYKLMLLIVEIIAHEVEHASHIRLIEEGADSLKRRILDLSIIPYKVLIPEWSSKICFNRDNFNLLAEITKKVNEIRTIQNKFYAIMPHEVMAEAGAMEFSLEILESLLFEYKDLQSLYDYNLNEYLKQILRHYENTLHPTYDYFKALGLFDIKEHFIDLSGEGLSLNERIRLGLEITEEERQQKRDEIGRVISMVPK